jgi:hypothetical protein
MDGRNSDMRWRLHRDLWVLSASSSAVQGACDARHKSASDVRYSGSSQHNAAYIG